MIKDEYEKLLRLFDISDSKDFNLEEVMQEAVLFFEELRKSYPGASKEEKQEMVLMIGNLHAKLREVAKRASESSGMTEEQLYEYSENPNNFSPEQWRLVQETRRKLYDSARKLTDAADREKKAQSPGSQAAKPAARPIRSPMRRARRSDWTKS